MNQTERFTRDSQTRLLRKHAMRLFVSPIDIVVIIRDPRGREDNDPADDDAAPPDQTVKGEEEFSTAARRQGVVVIGAAVILDATSKRKERNDMSYNPQKKGVSVMQGQHTMDGSRTGLLLASRCLG